MSAQHRPTFDPDPHRTDDVREARVGVVVVAAGAGTRLGSDGPKALVEVAGAPLVVHAVRRVLAAGLGAPVVVHPLEAAGEVARALAGLEVAALVPGAASRTASVRAGLAALATDVEVVAVHDAARPLTPTSVLRAAVVAVTGADDVLAAAPALPVADTLKRLAPGGTPQVVGTVDRRDLVGVQTPQVFPRAVLERALAAAEATDDLALVERALAEGEVTGRIVVVPGSWWGHKVTYEDDLALVRALAAAEQVPAAEAAAGEAAAGEAAVGQERS